MLTMPQVGGNHGEEAAGRAHGTTEDALGHLITTGMTSAGSTSVERRVVADLERRLGPTAVHLADTVVSEACLDRLGL